MFIAEDFTNTTRFQKDERLTVRISEKLGRSLLWAGLLTIFGSIAYGGASLALANAQSNGSAAMPQDVTDKPATMDSVTKANAFHEVLKKMSAGEKIDPQLWNTFVAAQNDGIKTGPAIGAKVPDFNLPDQNGKTHSLHELMGPKGLLLVFLRSADW